MFALRHQTSIWLSVLVGLLLVTAGCGEEVEPLEEGSLELGWEVSPHGCEEAGVDEIEARLEHAQRTYEERFSCADGEGRIDDIEPAKYDLHLVGFDSDDKKTFVSKTERVTVNAEQIREAPALRLTAKPVDLEVAWSFENSRVCGANGVDEVEVAVYDPAYYELARREFGCNAGSGTVHDLIAGEYIVEIVAEGEEDQVFQGFADTRVKRGERGNVEVVLEGLE